MAVQNAVASFSCIFDSKMGVATALPSPSESLELIAMSAHSIELSKKVYYLKYGHLAIPAKLHGPKGGRINESLLYILLYLLCTNFMQ